METPQVDELSNSSTSEDGFEPTVPIPCLFALTQDSPPGIPQGFGRTRVTSELGAADGDRYPYGQGVSRAMLSIKTNSLGTAESAQKMKPWIHRQERRSRIYWSIQIAVGVVA